MPRLYRHLCHIYGFGRPITLKTSASWCRHFEAVIKHSRSCSEYGCRHYGVLGKASVSVPFDSFRCASR